MGRNKRTLDESREREPKAAKRQKKRRGKKGAGPTTPAAPRFGIAGVAPSALLVGSGALVGAAVSWVLRGRSR